MVEAKRLSHIKELLAQRYPQPRTELKYNTPFQLLVAVVLSSQTTDKQVNKVTSVLFAAHPTPESILSLSPQELQEKIRGLGLYRHKSKYILELSRILVTEYSGQVPASRERLMALPGVGRKTANVVLANAFHIPAFAVDTHVSRVARRLGLTHETKAQAVENDLCCLFEPAEWNNWHHRLILHGRRYCYARSPRCSACFLHDHCPAADFSKKKDSKRRKEQ